MSNLNPANLVYKKCYSDHSLRKYSNVLYWADILVDQEVSEDIIRECFSDILASFIVPSQMFQLIWEHQQVSLDFVEFAIEYCLTNHIKFLWGHVAKLKILNKEFIEKYKSDLPMNIVTRHYILDPEFICKNRNLFNNAAMLNISMKIYDYYNLDNNFVEKIEKHKCGLWWMHIVKVLESDFEFTQNIVDNIPWYSVSEGITSLDFIDRFKEYVDWEGITSSVCQTLNGMRRHYTGHGAVDVRETYKETFEIIRKYKDKLSWYLFSVFGPIEALALKNVEFFTEFENYLYWEHVSRNHLPNEFLYKFKHKIEWSNYFSRNVIPESMIRRFIDDSLLETKYLKFVIRYQTLSSTFFDDYIHLFDPKEILKYQTHLDEDFLSKHIDILSLDTIIKAKTYRGKLLSMDFINKHKELLTENNIKLLFRHFIALEINKLPKFLGSTYKGKLALEEIKEQLMLCESEYEYLYDFKSVVYDIYSLNCFEIGHREKTRMPVVASLKRDIRCKENLSYFIKKHLTHKSQHPNEFAIIGKINLNAIPRSKKQIDKIKKAIGKLIGKMSKELGFDSPRSFCFVHEVNGKTFLRIGFVLDKDSQWVRTRTTVSLLSLVIHHLLVYIDLHDLVDLQTFTYNIDLKDFPHTQWKFIREVLLEGKDIMVEKTFRTNGLATFINRLRWCDKLSNYLLKGV